MDAPLSVLLRDGTHAGADIRLALKVEQVSISYSRSVIQVPIVQLSPIILDMGMVRPALTISGLVDTIGGDPTNTGSENDTAKTWHMESMVVSGQTYYIPYKAYLENKLVTWITDDGYTVQLEIGDATTPAASVSGTAATGGGIYEVVAQQVQFSVAPGTEDRWVYSVQFASKFRSDITF